ncbi:MAG: FHA domain-containing protein [Pseudomonadales bacterium]
MLVRLVRYDAGQEYCIEIYDFPFLIGRAAMELAALPSASLAQFSRQHAELFLQQGHLYISDLGSTNGTIVNSETVGRAAKRLSNGDVLTFGSEALTFTLAISNQDGSDEDTESDADTAAGQPVEDAEITATEILLPENEQMGPDTEPPGIDAAGAEVRVKAKPQPGRPRQQSDSSPPRLPAHRSAGPTDNKPAAEKKSAALRWWAFAVLIVLLAAISLFTWRTLSPATQAQKAYQAGDYKRTMQLLDEVLLEQDDAALRQMRDNAFVNWLLPQWLDNIEANDFEQAKTLLTAQAQFESADVKERTVTDLFAIVSDIAEFGQRRDGQVVLSVQDLQNLQNVLNVWRNKSHQFESVLADAAPALGARAESLRQIPSEVDLLRTEYAAELRAVDQLRRDVIAALRAKRYVDVYQLLADFRSRQIAQQLRLSGLDDYHHDLGILGELLVLKEQYQLLDFAAHLSQARFLTTEFTSQKKTLADSIADKQQLAAHKELAALWRKGELVQALNMAKAMRNGDLPVRNKAENGNNTTTSDLSKLYELRWQRAADEKLRHFQTTIQQYDALVVKPAARKSNASHARFYSQLSPVEDQFFCQQMEAELNGLKVLVLDQSRRDLRLASTAFSEYRQRFKSQDSTRHFRASGMELTEQLQQRGQLLDRVYPLVAAAERQKLANAASLLRQLNAELIAQFYAVEGGADRLQTAASQRLPRLQLPLKDAAAKMDKGK